MNEFWFNVVFFAILLSEPLLLLLFLLGCKVWRSIHNFLQRPVKVIDRGNENEVPEGA